MPLVVASFYACGEATESPPQAPSGGDRAVGGAFANGGAGSDQAGSNDVQGGTSVARGGARNAGGVVGSTGGKQTGGAPPAVGGAGAGEATAGTDAGGEGALGGAGGAGGEGDGGSGGEPPAEWQQCSTIVRANESVQRAINGATVPATVCVEAGVYREDLTLRGGVSLLGTRDTVICGIVDGSEAGQTRITTVSSLEVYGQVVATGRPLLTLQNLSINVGNRAACSVRQPAVKFAHVDGGAAALTAINVRVGSPGFDVSVAPNGKLFTSAIRIAGSRCEGAQCYAFLSYSLGDEEIVEGSSVQLMLTNNLIENAALEALAIELVPRVTGEQVDGFKIQFLHNTITSKGDPNAPINFRAPPTVPVVIANNVVAYTSKAMIHEGELTMLVNNLFSDDEASKAWFGDFDGGNYVPSAMSPLLGAGSADYTTLVDIDGRARGNRIDVGAFQR